MWQVKYDCENSQKEKANWPWTLDLMEQYANCSFTYAYNCKYANMQFRIHEYLSISRICG